MTTADANFGPYTLEQEIGRGAMGVVYAATQRSLNRRVALKVLRPEFLLDQDYRARFAREASSMAQLSSPHVPHIYEFGEHESQLFIASQLINGGNLDQLVTRRNSLSVEESLLLAGQICTALRDAHSVRVVHRDVKPSNVLIREGVQNHAYLCDFGIARSLDSDATATQALIGTLSYMAPERFDGVAATPASDLYSLGCLIWAMLSGSAPYLGTSTHVMMQHIREPIPTFDVSSPHADAVNYILRRAMAKDPRQRYAVADELLSDLAAAQEPIGRPGAGLTVAISQLPLPQPTVDRFSSTTEETVLRPLGGEPPASQESPVTPQPESSHSHRSPALLGGLALLAAAAVFGVGWASVALFGEEDTSPSQAVDKAGTTTGPTDPAPASDLASGDPPAETSGACSPGFYCLPKTGLGVPLSGDFDGDADPDFAVIAQNSAGEWGVSIAYSQGAGFEGASTWTGIGEWTPGTDTAVAADFTGDKLGDVMLLQPRSDQVVAVLMAGTSGGLRAPEDWATLPQISSVRSGTGGRFDQTTGAADLAILSEDAIYVIRSSGSQKGVPELWGAVPGGNLDGAQILGRNFDSDNVADIVVARRLGGEWSLDAMFSTETSFSSPVRWGTIPGDPHSFLARDIQRNQYTDIAALVAAKGGKATIRVLISAGSGFAPAPGFNASVSTQQPRSALLFGGDFGGGSISEPDADVVVVSADADGFARADLWLAQETAFSARKPLGRVDSWRWGV